MEGFDRRPEPADDPDRDLFDRLPALDRAAEQLERSFGRSCLLSLMVAVVLTLVLKRVLRLSWTGLAIAVAAVWIVALALLVRIQRTSAGPNGE